MADQEIDIPPGDKGVQLYKGDYLTLNFKSAAKFCITSGSADCFEPPLPAGKEEPKGHKYVGKVVCEDATIKYTHADNGNDCGSRRRDVPPGTIQIGSGIKK